MRGADAFTRPEVAQVVLAEVLGLGTDGWTDNFGFAILSLIILTIIFLGIRKCRDASVAFLPHLAGAETSSIVSSSIGG
jgi:hypothetical protein